MLPESVRPPILSRTSSASWTSPPTPETVPGIAMAKPLEPWCRYCGARGQRSTSRWRPGPKTWPRNGKKMLCNPHWSAWRAQKFVLPVEEPTAPIMPSENSTFRYLRERDGLDRVGIHSKMAHMKVLRRVVYETYSVDHIGDKVDRPAIEQLLGAKKPEKLGQLQADVTALYARFDGKKPEQWLLLENLVVDRDAEIVAATKRGLELTEELSNWRRVVDDCHRDTSCLARRLEAANTDVASPDAKETVPLEEYLKHPLLREAAAASMETEQYINRATKRIERELNVLYTTFITMQRELPHKLKGDMRLCKELRDSIRRKLHDVKTWGDTPDFGGGVMPEKRIYEDFINERFPHIPSALIYKDYAHIATWSFDMGETVTINHERFRLVVFKGNGSIMLQSARWLLSPQLHTFFPKVRYVAAFKDRFAVIIPHQVLKVPAANTIEIADFVRQLVQIFIVIDSVNTHHISDLCPPSDRPLTFGQLHVTVDAHVQVWPWPEAIPSVYTNACDRSPAVHRLMNWNLGMLLHKFCFGLYPAVSAGKVALLWPKTNMSDAVVSFLPMINGLLQGDENLNLQQLQCHPLLLTSATRAANRIANNNRDSKPYDMQLLRLSHQLFSSEMVRSATRTCSVSRHNIVADVLNCIIGMSLNDETFYHPIAWKYDDEDGIGAGVTKSVYTLFFRELLKHGLFETRGGAYMPAAPSKSAGDGVFPCSACPALSEPSLCCFMANPVEHWRAIGIMLALVFSRRVAVRIPISRCVTRYLQGKRVTLCDTVDYDPEMVKTFARYSGVPDIKPFDLTWDKLDREHPDIAITNETRSEYLRKKLQQEIVEEREPWLMTMRDGFLGFQFVRDNVAYLTTGALHSVLFGRITPGADELIDCLHFNVRSNLEQTLKQTVVAVIRRFTEAERAQFVEWTTGSEVVVPHESSRIKVVVQLDVDGGWPQTQTCFRKLLLPSYLARLSIEAVRTKFLEAFEYGSTFLKQ